MLGGGGVFSEDLLSMIYNSRSAIVGTRFIERFKEGRAPEGGGGEGKLMSEMRIQYYTGFEGVSMISQDSAGPVQKIMGTVG